MGVRGAMTDEATPLIGDDGSRSARRTRVGSLLSLIAAVAIVVASATARRGALGAQSCAEGRADVAFLIGGSVRGLVLDHVSKGLKTNVLDWMAERCVNAHPIMLLSIADVSGWRDRSAMFPKVYPHVLQRALDVIRPVAVSFYTASAYDLDTKDPWGQHCAARGFKVKKDDYFSPATTYAQFDVSKRLLCMARKVEQEKNIHFSWFVRSRPDYFWYGPPPVDFARTLWDGRGTDSAHAFIFDEDWRHKYNDALYAVHSSHADGILGPGSSILSKLPCRAEISATGDVFLGRMTPETALHKVVDLVGAASRAVGIGFERSARPTEKPGEGTLSCVDYTLQKHIHPCERAQAISVSETKVYRAQVSQWRSLNAYADDPPMQSLGPTC